MKEIQIFRNEIQIFRNEIQARTEQNQNPAERNPNSKSLDFLPRIELYQRVRLAPGCLSLLLSSFRLPGLSKQVKGWRHFDRGLRPCGTLGSCFRPTSWPRAARAETRRSRGVHGPSPGHEPGDRGPRGKRQADQSDVRQECVRLKEPDPVSSLCQTDGRQPFMPKEYLTNACL